MNKKIPPPPKPTAIMLANEIARLFEGIMRKECEMLGMKSGYRHVLLHIAMQDGLTQLDIVKRSHLKAPTISVTLQSMEKDGLIIREQDKTDQRQTRIFITPKGRELDAHIQKKLKETDKKLLVGLNEQDIRQLEQLLFKVRENALKAVQS